MTEFKLGDRVVARAYRSGDAFGDCYGTVSRVGETSVRAEDWSVGQPTGWMPFNLIEMAEENQIDLATVYAMGANSLGLALVVGGKTVTYLISRTSAASLAGRIAEKLADSA